MIVGRALRFLRLESEGRRGIVDIGVILRDGAAGGADGSNTAQNGQTEKTWEVMKCGAGRVSTLVSN